MAHITFKRPGRENGRPSLENGSGGPQKQLPGHRLELPRHDREVPRGRKIVPRHHPEAPRRHLDVRRSRFAHQLAHRETTCDDDLKARRDRWRMMLNRFVLTASRAKLTPHRLNPIDAHMRATRHRFTPSAAQAISTRDHFTQRNRQRQVIAYDMNVVEQEHLALATLMHLLVMPRLVFCSVHSPPITRLHAPIDARRSAALVAREHVRPDPAHPRRVTPVARLHRDEAAVLRWQRSRHSFPPARVARASRAPPRHPRRVTSVACGTSRCRAPPARNGRAAAPAPASREGCGDRYRSAARPCGLCVS